MTTVQSAPGPADVRAAGGSASRATSVPLSRLVLVELRKLGDTRAGLWLLIVIGLASVATSAILLLAAPDEEKNLSGLFAFAQLPAGVLLPVLGILSMTGEWTQRTALGTFTLEPRRGRVVAAKLVAAVVIAVLAALAVLPVALGANGVAAATGADASWSLEWQLVAQAVVLQVMWVLMGSAFGALLMNSPLAIVTFFALPMVWTILGETIRSLRTAASWLDINTTAGPLSQNDMTSGDWARLGVSVAVWVVVPLALGTWRVLRREVS